MKAIVFRDLPECDEYPEAWLSFGDLVDITGHPFSWDAWAWYVSLSIPLFRCGWIHDFVRNECAYGKLRLRIAVVYDSEYSPFLTVHRWREVPDPIETVSNFGIINGAL